MDVIFITSKCKILTNGCKKHNKLYTACKKSCKNFRICLIFAPKLFYLSHRSVLDKKWIKIAHQPISESARFVVELRGDVQALGFGELVTRQWAPRWVLVSTELKFQPSDFLPCWLHIPDGLHDVFVLFTCQLGNLERRHCLYLININNLCHNFEFLASFGKAKVVELISSILLRSSFNSNCCFVFLGNELE